MHRQGNGLLDRFDADEVAVGAVSATASPTVVEALGDRGFDYIWVDFEHGNASPWDAPMLEGLTRAADVGETELLARIPVGEPPLVRKVLDTGVRNLLIPRIETAEEVERAVRAARFSYEGTVGDRGLSGARANGYAADWADYTGREDRATLLGVMIENSTAVANLSDILSVPDLGFVMIGPQDLSMSLGHPNDPAHPEVRDVIAEVRNRAIEAGVPVGRPVIEDDEATMAESGYDLIMIGSDLGAARSQLGARLDALR